MPHGVKSEGAQYSTVTSSSQKFTLPMQPGLQYILTTSTDLWYALAATAGSVTARAASAVFVPAGGAVLLQNPDSATTNYFVFIIRDTADGHASLAIAQ